MLEVCRVYVIFIFITWFTLLRCEGALCFKRSLLLSNEWGKPEFPSPGCPKEMGCSGKVFVQGKGLWQECFIHLRAKQSSSKVLGNGKAVWKLFALL